MNAQVAQATFDDDERFVASQCAAADLYFFTRWMFLQRRGFRWLHNWHHEVVARALEDVFNGVIQNLIITIPPRYSKTELAVVNFVPWALGHYPDSEFIYTSYSGKMAATYSGEARDLIAHEAYSEIFPNVLLSMDQKAKADWKTTRGGALYAVGMGGSTTGMGAGRVRPGFGGAIIIDDPHKADEARSDTIRQGVIEWYQNTLQSRVNAPHTPKILIMQRLHENDLAGWLLGGGSGEKWTHVSLEALALEDSEHRKKGEALWSAKHTTEKLLAMQEAMPYTFSGQYQQRPSPPEGNIFKPDKITIEDLAPHDIEWVRGWDFAGTDDAPGKDPDYTAGFKLGLDARGKFWIGALEHFRGAPEKVEERLKLTTSLDGRGCAVDIPQDPGQAGKAQVVNFTKLLRGYRVRFSPETGDKVVRAEPFAAQVNVGNVSMVRGDWNDVVIHEMRNFPSGAHDDTIDAGSRAFNSLNAKRRLNITKSLLKRVAQ